MFLPRQEENDSTITGRRVQQSHLVWAETWQQSRYKQDKALTDGIVMHVVHHTFAVSSGETNRGSHPKETQLLYQYKLTKTMNMRHVQQSRRSQALAKIPYTYNEHQLC